MSDVPYFSRRRFTMGALAAAAWGALGALPAPAAAKALRAYASEKGLLFGSAISPDVFTDESYANLVTGQCNIVVPENALKWSSLSRSPGEYDFSMADRLYEFA